MLMRAEHDIVTLA